MRQKRPRKSLGGIQALPIAEMPAENSQTQMHGISPPGWGEKHPEVFRRGSVSTLWLRIQKVPEPLILSFPIGGKEGLNLPPSGSALLQSPEMGSWQGRC